MNIVLEELDRKTNPSDMIKEKELLFLIEKELNDFINTISIDYSNKWYKKGFTISSK